MNIASRLHDRVILQINHDLLKKTIEFNLDQSQTLTFIGVLFFSAESFFSKDIASSPQIFISNVNIVTESKLIELTKSKYSVEGRKKWGDFEDADILSRNSPLVHFNIYSIDWVFDIIAEKYNLG